MDTPIIGSIIEGFGDQAALFNDGINPVTNELVPIPRLQDAKFFLATSIIPPARAGTVFKTSHYAPRLEAVGLSVSGVENIVGRQVEAMRRHLATNADVRGRLRIGETLIEYRLRLLPNGDVSVGTIFPVKP